MIVINARIQAAPETIEQLKDILVTMEQASQAEDGCEDYTFSVELADSSILRITERWTSEEALKAHFKTPHMATFQAALQANPPGDMTLNCYAATEVPLPR